MASEGVTLTADQLRRLAKLIYLQEVEAIQNINFTSEPELIQYLRECKMGYEHTLKILDASKEATVKYQGDTTKEPIAHDIVTYAMKACNLAMLSVRNFTLRLSYLKKISEHSKQILLDLETLDATNEANVARLAKEAFAYKKAMLQYNKRYQSLPSSLFTDWIRESGMTFEELKRKYPFLKIKADIRSLKSSLNFVDQNVTLSMFAVSIRYQGVLGLPGAFKDLEMVDRLKVYNKVINESGLGNAKMTTFETASGAAGMTVLVFTAGLMVWDISTSHHKIHTAATDGCMVVSSVAGNIIGNAVKTALTIELVGLVEVSSITMPVVGFVVGVVAGLVISYIGNYFIDLIFGNGSEDAVLPLSTDGHRVYAAKMPDGKALARQIVYYS